MAIENVWIIDSFSGICIFDWCHETKEKTIDEQLVSGLLLAFRNFSSEAGLVEISAIEGIDRKLAYQADDRFIIASICHSKDFEPLINKSLQGLLKDFRKKYKKLLDEDQTTDVSPFRTFSNDIEETIEGTSAARTWISISVGSIMGMLMIGVFFIAFYFLNQITEYAFVVFIAGFIFAGFVSGLIAGDRRFGIISSFITVLPIFPFVILLARLGWENPTITDYIYYSLLYFLLFVIFSMMGGIIGGYFKERRKFYPMTEFIIEEQT
ncbi:MAG: hypothetical protein FK733_10695 [Asgard group archaeon]|nr:hypothetical protein [Asgard group archaeon]